MVFDTSPNSSPAESLAKMSKVLQPHPPVNCPLKSHSPSRAAGDGFPFYAGGTGPRPRRGFPEPRVLPGGVSGLRSRVTLRAGNSHLINMVKTGVQNRPFWTAVFSPKAFPLASETLTPRG